jgi:hypothetical protein
MQPSKITPRRAPSTRGRRPSSFPDLDLRSLAAQIGTKAIWLGRILNGHVRPSMGLASKLASLMGWTIDQVNQLYKPPQLHPHPAVNSVNSESSTSKGKPGYRNAKSRNGRAGHTGRTGRTAGKSDVAAGSNRNRKRNGKGPSRPRS